MPVPPVPLPARRRRGQGSVASGRRAQRFPNLIEQPLSVVQSALPAAQLGESASTPPTYVGREREYASIAASNCASASRHWPRHMLGGRVVLPAEPEHVPAAVPFDELCDAVAPFERAPVVADGLAGGDQEATGPRT
jgi:hypothetical protein